MSYKESTYHSKPVDKDGIASYTEEENEVWHTLISRQIDVVNERACEEYINGIDLLNLSHDRIPQCPDVSKALQKATGWTLEPVPALIPFEKFFHLLATRRFPAATFIRRKEELDYLQEPDIFHEIFGHCPLLTNPAYAEFTCMYGKLALNASKEDRAMLARLYWFTIEFGLIKNLVGTRVYGGGILSSKEETIYSLEDPNVQRKPFNALDVLRTPYRIDIKQPIYFVIDDFDALYDLTNQDLISLVREARSLGEFPPSYTVL
jgi:phenylalanine-4-hydroxylase